MKDRKLEMLRACQTQMAYMLGIIDTKDEKHNPMLDAIWGLISDIENLENPNDQ